MAYDNAVYGMKFRQWFGLPAGYGSDNTGDAATSGFALGSGCATHVASWYPSKPIKITGFGARAILAMGSGYCGTLPNMYWPMFLGRQGFRAEQADLCNTECIASLHMPIPTAKSALASIHVMASKTLAAVPAGSLVCIKAGTPSYPTAGTVLSAEGASNVACVAFFVDYSPHYTTGADAYWTE